MTQNLARHFLLDPAVSFLNHGSYGACPRPVFAAYQRWQRALERQPVAFLARDLTTHLRHSRTALAATLDAGPDDLVAIPNATQALNIVAHSLTLHPGDEILTTDHEYAALEKTWVHVADKTGARIVTVKIPLPLTSEPAFTATLLAAITPRTRVLFLSHITSATALLLPIANAIAAARAQGIITVIDGAHTPGHIPLNLTDLNADFYVGNCHKWLMAPKGAAFLYASRDRQHLITPQTISHGWSENPAAPGPFGNSRFIDMLEMQGTRDPAALLAIPAAITFLARHNWPAIADTCHHLAQHTAARINALTGLQALSTPAFCAPQMVAIQLPPCDPAALQQALYQRHAIEIPCLTWRNYCLIRLSVQGYNTPAQMDHLVAALTDLLSELTTS